jgi:hypothetical protein
MSEPMKRVATQIAILDDAACSPHLYAVANDGTMWVASLLVAHSILSWERLPNLPQPAETLKLEARDAE